MLPRRPSKPVKEYSRYLTQPGTQEYAEYYARFNPAQQHPQWFAMELGRFAELQYIGPEQLALVALKWPHPAFFAPNGIRCYQIAPFFLHGLRSSNGKKDIWVLYEQAIRAGYTVYDGRFAEHEYY